MINANALDLAFAAARRDGRAALMPYLTGGFPDPTTYVDLAVAVLEGGADVLEIGIPFSDPLLDGPSTQRSQQVALDSGVTPRECMRFAGEIHNRIQETRGVSPALCFMGAYNPIYAFGLAKFCQDAASAGVTGLIVPDLPTEEQEPLRREVDEVGLHLIQMVAPTSSDDRIRHVCSLASGFVYCISVSGVTGARADVVATARPLVERVRRHTDLPVAVGFGISGPVAAREIAAFADGVIVGSALTTILADAPPGESTAAGAHFVRDIRGALESEKTT